MEPFRQDPKATRDEALARLGRAVPGLGRAYAVGRNHDSGPGQPSAVSGLSPWIRRRLVTEAEVVAAALAAHGPQAGKFVEEVLWRGYVKGWLEQRPQVWDSYRDGVVSDLDALSRDGALRERVDRAAAGRTGLACFDAWVTELARTGTLHNHARMWFASIWIFTLGLPWRLGADLFLRQLLDGDPASNTLGWRWVAGLHTRGKPYAATAGNITAFTGGRFTPRPEDLARVTRGLEATEPQGLPPLQPIRRALAPRPGVPTALMITEEDCTPPTQPLDLRAVATVSASHLRSPLPVAPAVARFEAAALADAAARLSGLPVAALRAGPPEALAQWAAAAGVAQVVTAFVPRGPLRDWLDRAVPCLSARGIALAEWQRDWDRAIWPHATAGFFRLRQEIPRLLRDLLPGAEAS